MPNAFETFVSRRKAAFAAVRSALASGDLKAALSAWIEFEASFDYHTSGALRFPEPPSRSTVVPRGN